MLQHEIKSLASNGIVPAVQIWKELAAADAHACKLDPTMPEEGRYTRVHMKIRPLMMGQAAGCIQSVIPARQIIDEMVEGAVRCIEAASSMILPRMTAKL